MAKWSLTRVSRIYNGEMVLRKLDNHMQKSKIEHLYYTKKNQLKMN